MKNCSNKQCPNNNPQSLDNFYNDKGFKSGKMARCKTCKSANVEQWRDKNRPQYNTYTAGWRKRNPDKQHKMEIKRHYGLSIEDYNKMLTAQACGCKICGKQHDPSKKRGRLYVDHCHATGEVRGLLCGACNSAIGYFDDQPELLAKAIAYLNETKKKLKVV